ncbi:MAG: FAD:protein FMN transferase [Bacteroidales bacterium]|nr:FAD:protein FMN transferase [Bacteroidales bacterium]
MKRIYWLLLACCLLFFSCKKNEVHQFGGAVFGTYFSVNYTGEENPDLPRQVDSILQNINKLYSIFDSTSLVSKLNRNEPVVPSPAFAAMVRDALDISKNTGGAFDITVGPLVNLWGFGNENGGIVSQEAIDSVRQFVGYTKIHVGDDGGITKDDERIKLDFNAIAKGKAVDDVADFLVRRSYANCLVNIGGEVRCEGTKTGRKAWRVGIQIPTETRDGLEEADYIFEMTGRAVATSGNYRNYKEIDGQRYCHITDPRSGDSRSSNLLSVTVIANQCAVADAYATAFMVMGLDEAMKFLESHPELAAHFIYYENGGYQYKQSGNFPKQQ